MMRSIPLILFGVGGVGRSFIRQIVENREFHAREYGLRLEILAVCDSASAVIDLDNGLDDTLLRDLLDLKTAGRSLTDHALGASQGDLTGIVDIAGRAGAIVIDCTATDATVPALLFALEQGYRIVLANKKPLTVQQEVYDRLTRAGATNAGPPQLGRSRWETTVGAALPVIVTLNRLVASGDEIKRIAGTFSGTLGYVMTGLQQGKPFSAIVREAHQLGYTEPDPRDDLGGVDVARKALILARGLGWRLNLADVKVTGLYPTEMSSLSVSEFLEALPRLDVQFAARVQAAQNEGNVLRYAATVENGQCHVGPVTVDLNSPLGRLSGTDNLVEFYTRWYTPNPLVVQGRGAGVDATAAGVLSDVIDLTYTE